MSQKEREEEGRFEEERRKDRLMKLKLEYERDDPVILRETREYSIWLRKQGRETEAQAHERMLHRILSKGDAELRRDYEGQ